MLAATQPAYSQRASFILHENEGHQRGCASCHEQDVKEL